MKIRLFGHFNVYFAFTIFALLVLLAPQCLNTNAQSPSKLGEPRTILTDENPLFSALPTEIRYPENNKQTLEKFELGRLLFYDPILSGEKDIACATCHHPSQGYAEFRDISIGTTGKGLGSKRTFTEENAIPFLKRNANTVVNTAFTGIDKSGNYTPEFAKMFWDSRVYSLETQAIEPLIAFEEMRGPNYERHEILPEIIKRLERIGEYRELFDRVFEEEHPINERNIGKAIAAFERSLISNNTRFDQYLRGDYKAISKAEKHGFHLFKKVGCANCHFGPMLSDFAEHTLGIPENEKLTKYDKGLYEDYAFRTPSLRNLRYTAPYCTMEHLVH